MIPDPLTAALTAAVAAAAVLIAVVAKRAAKNGTSKPPPPVLPPAPAPAADSGSYLSIPALIGEQLQIHIQPVSQRLDRIEDGQKDQTAAVGALAQRVAGVEARLDERKPT